MRRTVLAGFLSIFVFLAVTTTAFAQLTEQKVPGVRLVFVDGPESFLVPHATRTALNSLRSQKKILGFEPWKKPTVLVVDPTRAGASTRPNDRLHRAPSRHLRRSPPTSGEHAVEPRVRPHRDDGRAPT
jgi:hypothetical protein